MLSVTGLNHFYYVRDFTDMRCKHSRVLSIIHRYDYFLKTPCTTGLRKARNTLTSWFSY